MRVPDRLKHLKHICFKACIANEQLSSGNLRKENVPFMLASMPFLQIPFFSHPYPYLFKTRQKRLIASLTGFNALMHIKILVDSLTHSHGPPKAF